ncbi:hypothetical protein AAG570_008203 [Ranatra chinensis]|uniref:Uncharacterized protein n=1 Tax=Ranatra chinensis TaxID=642074 RepID=A0ABD0XSH0_9HEMI
MRDSLSVDPEPVHYARLLMAPVSTFMTDEFLAAQDSLVNPGDSRGDMTSSANVAMWLNVFGVELLKNKTLQFFSRTLPILQADETIPKVTKYQELNFQHSDENNEFCMLYRAIQGEPLGSGLMERREDAISEYRKVDSTTDSPPTPCPAKVEYVTPVFARNYQGIWRYVVQIPYEGYFTQTVEVTKCMYVYLYVIME